MPNPETTIKEYTADELNELSDKELNKVLAEHIGYEGITNVQGRYWGTYDGKYDAIPNFTESLAIVHQIEVALLYPNSERVEVYTGCLNDIFEEEDEKHNPGYGILASAKQRVKGLIFTCQIDVLWQEEEEDDEEG